jgi:hypothetical protein
MSKQIEVQVHDGYELTSKAVDSARHAQLMAFVKSHDIVGDGSDVDGPKTAKDAGEAQSFLVSQLTYTEAKIYERQYLKMQFRQVLPVSNEAGPWAEGYRYEKTDFTGQPKWASERSDRFPTANVQYDETLNPFHHALLGYEYTLQELRQSAYLRRPINERKMVACMEMVERFYNRIGLYGDKQKKLTGLFNSTQIPQDIAASGKWDASATSPLTILNEFNAFLYAPYAASGFNDIPDTALIPPQAFNVFATTPVVLAGGTVIAPTILAYLKANCLGKQLVGESFNMTILPGFGLDKAGAATKGGTPGGNNSRCVCYVNNIDRVVFHIPMPQTFVAPQFQGAVVLVPGETRVGGVEFRYPASAFYLDKVLNAG